MLKTDGMCALPMLGCSQGCRGVGGTTEKSTAWRPSDRTGFSQSTGWAKSVPCSPRSPVWHPSSKLARPMASVIADMTLRRLWWNIPSTSEEARVQSLSAESDHFQSDIHSAPAHLDSSKWTFSTYLYNPALQALTGESSILD